MSEWDGKDRRQRSDFEADVLKFMARIDEHMANQLMRCDSHAADIKELQDQVCPIDGIKKDIGWIDRWVATAWAAIIAIVGYLAYGGGNTGGR